MRSSVKGVAVRFLTITRCGLKLQCQWCHFSMTEEKKRDPIEIEISGQEAFVNPTPEELWRMAMKQLLKLAIEELDARPIEM